MRRRGFYQPEGAWVGDVIPWQHDGEFRLFYLHETRAIPKEGMPWLQVVTRNLVDFDETGVALPSGGRFAADFNAYTGSVVTDDTGTHHVFYTGQNPEHIGHDGLPLQLVMHATSQDGGKSWQRHPAHTFGATAGYETADWRDPFVFRDEEAQVWRMLITARHSEGPAHRRGVIAQCVSVDLQHWEPVAPFWDPRRYIAHECPEVFHWGEWWYLVFSEFSDSFTTRFRMARNLHGPWIVPEHDTIDGRAFYAAKSAERNGHRYFFGWIASRAGSTDDGAWEWAGTLSTLEAEQRSDGTLAFHPTEELRATFEPSQTCIADMPVVLDAPEGYADFITSVDAPDSFRLTVSIEIGPDATECGVILRASADGDEGYILRLEPKRDRLVFDRWPRRPTGTEQWQISGDVPFAVELERPCDLSPGVHDLDVIVVDGLCIATVDDCVVLSTRLYDRPAGRTGVFVGEGRITVNEFALSARRPTTDFDHASDGALLATVR